MANARVEIHDPFGNHDDLSAPSSDAEGLQNTLEFRLLMAYTKKRQRLRQKRSQVVVKDQGPLPDRSEEETTPKKTKIKFKMMSRILACVKPKTVKCPKESEAENIVVEEGFRSVSPVESNESEEMDEVASRLTEIADEIPFAPPELETDSPDDEDANVEKLLGLLLRECGDNFDEMVTKELKEALRSTLLFWNYGFFERLMKTLLKRMGLFNADPDAPGPQTSPKTQMAVACEVTSRLSAANTLPVNRLLGYGATYLQNHFSSWAKQQGGYEAAFDDDDDDDDDDDVQ
ncbi:apoptosis facilitator Bcl-2-like protein 14 isoform X2 [Hippocampus zosterae]|uniref:apoptosis facilitator Bcl-2-like protein 14 isoform X2 n=1 Tax=Hippocampus zosterae TaxID=109293 RepID=UPI00223DF7AD|nr:apoptosis facilitator Bcl-2-like protein 14 isoform X2 [Hippocampus zosterae]